MRSFHNNDGCVGFIPARMVRTTGSAAIDKFDDDCPALIPHIEIDINTGVFACFGVLIDVNALTGIINPKICHPEKRCRMARLVCPVMQWLWNALLLNFVNSGKINQAKHPYIFNR